MFSCGRIGLLGLSSSFGFFVTMGSSPLGDDKFPVCSSSSESSSSS